jgi:hypothetical protein
MGFQDRLQSFARPATAAARPQEIEDNRRWARRKARNAPAAIMFPGITTPIACIVRDTSSTGAMIEMVKDKYNAEGSTKVVEDEFTLTITLDKTYVQCRVQWRSGTRIGVRFLGPVVAMPQQKKMPVRVVPGGKR